MNLDHQKASAEEFLKNDAGPESAGASGKAVEATVGSASKGMVPKKTKGAARGQAKASGARSGRQLWADVAPLGAAAIFAERAKDSATDRAGAALSYLAFSGAHQELGPFRVQNGDGVEQLVAALLGEMMAAWDAMEIGAADKKKKKAEAAEAANEEELDSAADGDGGAGEAIEAEAVAKTAASKKEIAKKGKTVSEPEKLVGVGERFAWLSNIVAQGAHSHPGKYINPSSQMRWVAKPDNKRHHFLSSQSVGHRTRWMSAVFTHASNMSKAGLIFYAQFEIEMEGGAGSAISCLGEMIANRDQRAIDALAKAGVPPEAVEKAVEHWAATFGNTMDQEEAPGERLPTLLWPKFENGRWHYDALTALPSLAVCNAIMKMRRNPPEGEWIPTTSFVVGSTKQVNISVAATHVAGAVGLLRCSPPKITRDEAEWLFGKAAAGAGAGLIKKSTADGAQALAEAAELIGRWPNERRRLKLRSMARQRVSEAIQSLAHLRDFVEAEPDRRGRLPKMERMFMSAIDGLGMRNAERGLWADAVIDAGMREGLAKHSKESQESYQDFIWLALISEFGEDRAKGCEEGKA